MIKNRIARTMLVFVCLAAMAAGGAAEVNLQWAQLPPVPDPLGFGGHFSGVSGGALLVAGGSNFPEKMPWESGRKAWYDTGYVLERVNGPWRAAFKLPRSLGYGVSVSAPDGLYCIGGSGAAEHVRDVLRVRRSSTGWQCEAISPLPKPLAYACGALVGKSIYVTGGTVSPDATAALNEFWALNCRKPGAGWRELEPLPGPGRILAVAAAVRGDFYVAGGASLAPDADGKPARNYLKDAYRYSDGKGWVRVADLPSPVVAAPTPAPVVGKDTFLVIGGDDGALVHFEPKSQHPGFPNKILSYDTRNDQWTVVSRTPWPRVTTPAVAWKGRIVLPSGEARPGVRSPEVWAATVKRSR